nr:MAG TPA: hypothetical protein [Caudoviricetes sp.]
MFTSLNCDYTDFTNIFNPPLILTCHLTGNIYICLHPIIHQINIICNICYGSYIQIINKTL